MKNSSSGKRRSSHSTRGSLADQRNSIRVSQETISGRRVLLMAVGSFHERTERLAVFQVTDLGGQTQTEPDAILSHLDQRSTAGINHKMGHVCLGLDGVPGRDRTA